jgi:ABC-2 type transport system ATP-binding protein
MDSFELLQKYYELDNTLFKSRVQEMAELLNVTQLLHVHVRKLSLGERMKMELMASLLHSPEVIFLDEPTIGLDLLAQEKIREFIKDYHEKNHATIVITSHYMADVQALCKKLVLIFDGEKRFDDTIENFEKILGHEKNVSFSFESQPDKSSPLLTKFDAKWNNEGNIIEFRVPEKDLRDFSMQILRDFPVCEFNTEKLPIERVMKTLMENPHILGKS